jgi:biopolymer transport protein ExbB
MLQTLAVAALATLAQAPAIPADAPEAPAEPVPTVVDLFQASPYVNSIILILSLVALAVFALVLLDLTSRSYAPARFIDDVTKLILNRRFDQAIHLCQNRSHLFSAGVIQRLVENRDKDHGVLIGILEAEGKRRGDVLWNRIGYLVEVAALAPTLGLLGTVLGMIDVFFDLTRDVGNVEQVGRMSEGIARAMGTTMFGLIVALAAGMFYAIAKSRATAVLADTEQVCHTVADHTWRAARAGAPIDTTGDQS